MIYVAFPNDFDFTQQICEAFDMKDYCKEKQLEYQRQSALAKREAVNDNEDSPLAKRMKIAEGAIEEHIAFIRSNYLKDTELPKSILHMHTKKKLRTVPGYETEQNDRVFRAALTLNNKKYSSTFWDKNKKSAEQSAAMVCMLHLGLITKEELVENGSMNVFES